MSAAESLGINTDCNRGRAVILAAPHGFLWHVGFCAHERCPGASASETVAGACYMWRSVEGLVRLGSEVLKSCLTISVKSSEKRTSKRKA